MTSIPLGPPEDVAPDLPGARDECRLERGILRCRGAGRVAAREVKRAIARVGTAAGEQVGIVQERQHAAADPAQRGQQLERPAGGVQVADDDDLRVEPGDFHEQAGDHGLVRQGFAALEMVDLANPEPQVGIDHPGGDIFQLDVAMRPGENPRLDTEAHDALELARLGDARAILEAHVIEEEDAPGQVGRAAFVGNGSHDGEAAGIFFSRKTPVMAGPTWLR